MNHEAQRLYSNAKLLVRRLERLSADSIWARRASGLRGSLLRELSLFNDPQNKSCLDKLESLVSDGFIMLEKAAKEIPDIEATLKEFE